jgi:hypothetical protein
MFQYAAGRRVALRAGCDLLLDVRWLAGGREASPDARPFELGRFRITARVATRADLLAVDSGAARGIRRVRRALQRGVEQGHSVIRQAVAGYDAVILTADAGSYLDGYWQSADYFEDIAATIRAELQPVDAPSAQDARLAERLAEGATACLHVRRGDYVDNPAAAALHGLCGGDYYQRALQALEPHFPVNEVWVATDDREWVAGSLQALLGRELRLLPARSQAESLWDLWLMARSSALVTANSSFSWWAGWLGERSGRIVVAPAEWFRGAAAGQRRAADICPDRWLRV